MKIHGTIGLLCLLLVGPAITRARDLNGLREFPGDLLRGVREEGHPEELMILLASGAGASVARYGKTTVFDDFRVADTLQANAPLGKRVTDVGAVVGYPGYLMAAMGATYFAAWRFDATPAQEFGLLGFEALSLAGIQTLILKVSVPRLRPDSTDRTAFPSGHTAASFSLATAAASQYGWTVGIPACIAASFVGYTRMEGQNHYLSDVLFGAGLGIVSGRAAYKARRRTHPDRYAFAPFVTSDGGGVRIFF